jgi:hypothetical protein
MKKQQNQKDIYETRIWAGIAVTDPYQVLAETFSTSGTYRLKFFIQRLIESATSEGIYDDKPPVDALLYTRLIHSVIKAAHVLKDTKRSAIEVDDDDLLNPAFFACNRMFHDAWIDFPRFLSKKEFCNPYSVFRRFFKFLSMQNWVDYWREAGDRALSPESSNYDISELKTCTHLFKLIEAAHLIDVREVAHVRGNLKTKFRGLQDEDF